MPKQRRGQCMRDWKVHGQLPVSASAAWKSHSESANRVVAMRSHAPHHPQKRICNVAFSKSLSCASGNLVMKTLSVKALRRNFMRMPPVKEVPAPIHVSATVPLIWRALLRWGALNWPIFLVVSPLAIFNEHQHRVAKGDRPATLSRRYSSPGLAEQPLARIGPTVMATRPVWASPVVVLPWVNLLLACLEARNSRAYVRSTIISARFMYSNFQLTYYLPNYYTSTYVTFYAQIPPFMDLFLH